MELRGINNQFNLDTVWVGRRVELRRGYSTDESLWGTITEVETFDSIESIPESTAAKINPDVSYDEFIPEAKELLSKYDEFIAFRVSLD